MELTVSSYDEGYEVECSLLECLPTVICCRAEEQDCENRGTWN